LKHTEPRFDSGYSFTFTQVCTHAIGLILAAGVASSRESLQQAAGCLV
jgi:hypothetical protein